MNRVLLLLPGLLFLASVSAFAQGSSKIFTTPLAGTVILRDVPDKYNAAVISFEAPDPDGAAGQEEFRVLKEQVARQFPHRRQNVSGAAAKTTAVLQPIIVKAFVPDSNSAIPPDNNIAINKGTDGVNVMNSRIATLNVGTGTITAVKALSAFTSSVGLNDPTVDGRYDPKVVYDPENDRFICVILSGTNGNNNIIFCFSQTSDPGGAWNFYTMHGDYAADTTWFDYPIIAITHKELFLTGNKLVYNGSFQTGFRRSLIYQVRKSDGYAGLPLTATIWDTVNYGGAPIRNIFPVNGGSGIAGPAQYFLSVRNVAALNDSVFLMKIPDTIGAAGNAISVSAYVSNLNYGFPPDGRQPATAKVLQTNDARVLGAFAEGSEIQFVSTTVQPGTGSAAIYHGRINNYTTAPTVQANYITVDTMDFGYPNLSYTGQVSGNNSSIISFDYTGPTVYPGLGAVMWDGSGYSPLLKVKTGEGIINTLSGNGQRWGDYSGSQPLWGKPGNVWIAGIWGRSNARYGIWSAQLRSPFTTGIASGAPPAVATQLYPNPAMRYVRLRFSLKENAMLHFALYTMTGSLVDAVLDASCREGENEIQFNTAPLAPGQYLLKGVTATGRALMTKTFVKQ